MTKAKIGNFNKVACVAICLTSTILFWGCASTRPTDATSPAPKRHFTFDREFSPSEGIVKGSEADTRQEICLNGKWDFQPIYGPYDEKRTPPYGIDEDDGGKALAPELPFPMETGWESTKIKIPCSWNAIAEFPSYPQKWADAQMGWLRKKFTVPKSWSNKRILIDFQAVSGDSKIFLNGQQIGTNFDSVLPFKIDITDCVKKGAENEIMVGIRGRGFFNWQSTYGNITVPPGAPALGIWQDVFVLAVPDVYVADLYVKPEVSKNCLSAEVTIKNTTAEDKSVEVGADVRQWHNLAGKKMLNAPEIKWALGEKAVGLEPVVVIIPANQETIVTLKKKVNGELKYWNFSSPNLYGMTASVSAGGTVLDKKYERFGWREFKISGKKFLLNGKKIQLLGDSQHLQNPTYLTRRFAWSWFTMLKDIGGNAARLHAMVWPEYLHDMADEMGIALLPESSVYASSCDLNYDSDLFWKSTANNVRGMVAKYRNHPSVFGWSIENEALPALSVKCNDQAYKEKVYSSFGKVADICRELDATRDWISGDGSKDEGGRLPIFSEHYGSTETYKNESFGTTKPYGVGEACIAYYATPHQAEMYVGDRAYRSYKDFCDAVAINAYELLKVQRQVCDYCSVWNAGYYGVEELPVGMADTSKAPANNDGVFLSAPYMEGKPGIQLERIPPYAVQFNPGYDVRYPLYKPLPLLSAIKAAYHQPGPTSCEWDHREAFTNPPPPFIQNPVNEVLFVGQEEGDLFFKLKSAGVPISTQVSGAKLIVVDCDFANVDDTLIIKIQKAVKAGATVFFWGLKPENENKYAAFLPYPIQTFKRAATSLIHNEADNRVASIPYKDLYFSENTDSKAIMKYGLKGNFVNRGKVLLAACPVDWSRGNNGGMMRSERESSADPCLVEVKDGPGSYIASSVNLEVMSPAHVRMIAELFRNFGVEVNPVRVRRGSLFDQTLVLTRTLIAGYRTGDTGQAMDTDFLNGEAKIKPEYQMPAGRSSWDVFEAKDGLFKAPGLQNGTSNSDVIYLSFWVQCPQALNEIMTDPNVPEVNLKYSSRGGSKIWLNGQEKAFQAQSTTDFVVEKLPLIKGWNHFLVKVVRPADGDWSFKGRIISKNFGLLASLNSALNPFSDKANFYTIDHTDPEIKYDQNWELQGDGWYQSFTPGSKARFKFYGTGITLKGRVGPDGGKAKLYIDGRFEQLINYQKELNNRRVELYSKSGFRDGDHEVVIEVVEGRVAVGPYDQWESYK